MSNIKQVCIMYSIGWIGFLILSIFNIIERVFMKPAQIDIKLLYIKQEEYKKQKALKILEKDNYTT